MICLPLTGWAYYQLQRGEVYTHTGRTKFSPVAWITRESDPEKFWGTVVTQFAAGIILSGIAIAKFGI